MSNADQMYIMKGPESREIIYLSDFPESKIELLGKSFKIP